MKQAAEPAGDQEREAKAAALYQQLLRAQAQSEWLNVVMLAAQIEVVRPDYQDVAALKAVALQQLQKPVTGPAKTTTPPPETDTVVKETAKPETKTKQRETSQPKETTAKTTTTKQVEPTGDTFIHEKTGLEFVRIPAGEFICSRSPVQKKKFLGSVKTEYEEGKMQLPEFWISKTPVTQAVYRRFIAANPKRDVPFREEDRTKPYNWDAKKRTHPADKTDHPVVLVSWYDALAFCEWAGLQLPTEEQWEKAARGTDGRTYPWGNNAPMDKLCNFNLNVGGTTPVGQYSPQGDSPYGCVDMSGNVWEWCLNKYEKPNATGIDQSGYWRVLRGGSWFYNANLAGAAYRNHRAPDNRHYGIGFRVVARRPPSQ